jgi:hypothetical protein
MGWYAPWGRDLRSLMLHKHTTGAASHLYGPALLISLDRAHISMAVRPSGNTDSAPPPRCSKGGGGARSGFLRGPPLSVAATVQVCVVLPAQLGGGKGLLWEGQGTSPPVTLPPRGLSPVLLVVN